MRIRKVLLKDRSGTPVSSLTLRFGNPGIVEFPNGFTPIARLKDRETIFAGERDFFLLSESEDFSVLGTLNGKRLFASTLTGEQAAFAKWRLEEAASAKNEEALLPKSPLEPFSPKRDQAKEIEEESSPSSEESSEPFQEENAPVLSSSQTGNAPFTDEAPASPEEEKAQKLARALVQLEKGEHFSLFEETMPSSRWAKIKEEEGEYLIGVIEEEEGTRVLCGVAGVRDCPPDEDRLWTFFPVDGEEGYYLTEA